ncbi:hypothetical protein FDECE_3761 [Fusarium decemcellulare]|nr:hypothetical protein FDECE_3761 [Fusarium decemcellulare]
METFQRKTLVTRRSLKYTYYVSPIGESTKLHPSLLFLHGFPDSSHLWADVVSQLLDLPNKIIVPDCLGYAGSDKPNDTSLYSYKGQSDDLVDILDNEEASLTVVVGHDWGSALAQRMYLFHPELFSGVVLLNTGYMVPSDEPFSLDAVNELTEKTLGYPQFSYWNFFLGPDAARIVDTNLERMWQVLHGDAPGWMKDMFCVPNAMQEFLVSNDHIPLKSYAREARWKEAFMEQFKKDGFASALHMYKATAFNIQSKSDSAIPRDRLAIKVPMLWLICSKDDVCVPEMMDQAKNEGLVPKLKEVVIDCGHWSPMERPEEIAAHIRHFVKDMN